MPRAKKPTAAGTLHRCDNCGWEARIADDDESFGLHRVSDLYERLTPGGVVPSGECLDCGALAYPVEETEPPSPAQAKGGGVTESLRDCTGAIQSLLDQIDQMRGMFNDEDGCIKEAVDSGNAAITAAHQALSQAAHA